MILKNPTKCNYSLFCSLLSIRMLYLVIVWLVIFIQILDSKSWTMRLSGPWRAAELHYQGWFSTMDRVHCCSRILFPRAGSKPFHPTASFTLFGWVSFLYIPLIIMPHIHLLDLTRRSNNTFCVYLNWRKSREVAQKTFDNLSGVAVFFVVFHFE